jgi:DNA polymerase I
MVSNSDYKQHCYVKPETLPQIKEIMGINNVENVDIYDVIKDESREMVKVSVDNPSVIYDLRDNGVCWEGDIKYYQSFLYDKKYVVGTWYEVDNDNITPLKSKDNIQLKNIDMESVVDTESFAEQVTKWANLLGQDIPNIKRLAFDIEVEVGDTMPDTTKALQRITAISFHSDDIQEVYTLKRPEVAMGEDDPEKKYNIKWFDSEKELLEEAFKVIDSYPLVLTYNGDLFDMPYLYNRANVLGLEYNPFKMMKEKATLNNGIHVDLYGVFSNRSLKIYAFGAKYVTDKLDDVSQAMLGEKKVDYVGSLADISLNLLSKYCYNDSRLTYELSHYNNDLVMNLLVILCRVANMPIDDISRLSISNWIKGMFYNEHRINNQLIPRSSDLPQVEATTQAGIKGKKYQGAEVLEPVSGIHFDVTVLDFASLYPSIIKTRNISYDTVCCSHEVCKNNIIPYTKHWSCTKKIGMASLLIGSLKELRVNHFKVLSKKAKTKKDRDINNTIAQALKVFLNASYGVIGAETFSLYFLPSAEAVTAVGRNIISKTIETAKSKSLPVLYGDTDSVFVHNPTKEQVDYLIDFCKKHYSIDLEIDKEYKYLVLSDRKKNYFGVKKDGNLDIKGLSGKKSNTPPFVKRLFNDVLEKLKPIENISDFNEVKQEIRYVMKTVIDDFDKIPLDQLAFKVMIAKNPAEYKSKPQAVKAGEQLGNVEKGQFVEFVKTWVDPKVCPLSMAKRKDIDKQKYMDSLETVMSQICEPMNISMDSLMGRGEQTELTQW